MDINGFNAVFEPWEPDHGVLWFDNHARGIVMKNNKGIGVVVRFPCERSGAGGRIRTAYLLITNQLLYQLSYAGPDYRWTGRGSLAVVSDL